MLSLPISQDMYEELDETLLDYLADPATYRDYLTREKRADDIAGHARAPMSCPLQRYLYECLRTRADNAAFWRELILVTVQGDSVVLYWSLSSLNSNTVETYAFEPPDWVSDFTNTVDEGKETGAPITCDRAVWYLDGIIMRQREDGER